MEVLGSHRDARSPCPQSEEARRRVRRLRDPGPVCPPPRRPDLRRQGPSVGGPPDPRGVRRRPLLDLLPLRPLPPPTTSLPLEWNKKDGLFCSIPRNILAGRECLGYNVTNEYGKPREAPGSRDRHPGPQRISGHQRG